MSMEPSVGAWLDGLVFWSSVGESTAAPDAYGGTGGPRATSYISDLLCALTDPGLARKSNEDVFGIALGGLGWIVADGMGGRNAGEIAAALAVEEIEAAIETHSASAQERLRAGFLRAQRRVLAQGSAAPSLAGMGAAVVAGILEGDVLHVGHSGDARAYLARSGEMRRLTRDHSSISKLIALGKLTWEEARGRPGRSRLTQAVGTRESFAPEFVCVPLEQGDVVLLCSDGLWDEISEREIREVLLADAAAPQMANILLARALAAGGRDNVTLVLYRHSS